VKVLIEGDFRIIFCGFNDDHPEATTEICNNKGDDEEAEDSVTVHNEVLHHDALLLGLTAFEEGLQQGVET
jgi:hypothetical protein